MPNRNVLAIKRGDKKASGKKKSKINNTKLQKNDNPSSFKRMDGGIDESKMTRSSQIKSREVIASKRQNSKDKGSTSILRIGSHTTMDEPKSLQSVNTTITSEQNPLVFLQTRGYKTTRVLGQGAFAR